MAANEGWGRPPGGAPLKGVVLAKYVPPPDLPVDLALTLQIGDRVLVKNQTQGWYFGELEAGTRGIFPRSFVHILEDDEEKSPIMTEIDSSLKEFESTARRLFSTSKTDIKGK